MEQPKLRFGDFELDCAAGELHRDGVALRLQGKPLLVLEALLERPGTLVSRDQLRRRLWATDTYVDFDNSLNNAVNRLRAALGDDAAQPRFVETVGRRGYRFTASVERLATTPPAPSPRGVPLARSFVALPFRLLRPDPQIEFLVQGLPDTVSAALAGLESLRVRSSLAAARHASAAADLKQVAAELDVDLVLMGTLLRDQGRIRVQTQLVEARTGSLLWTHSAEAMLGRIFELQDELARGILESLALPLTVHERELLRHDVPASGEAFELYLRANRLTGGPGPLDDLVAGRDLYLQSIRQDPGYAPAWARLGRTYRIMAKYAGEEAEETAARAEECLSRALALNPELSMAHHLYAQLEIDGGRVKHALVRLVGRARQHRSDPHLFAALVQACRYVDLLPDSLVADGRARALDPGLRTSVCHTLWAAGEAQQALEESRRIGDPSLPLFLAALGRTEEALRVVEQEQRLLEGHGLQISQLRGLAAVLRGDCRSSAEAAEAVLRSPFPDPEGWCYSASIWSHSDKRVAERMLLRAVERGLASLALVEVDPGLRELAASGGFGDARRLVEARRAEAVEAFRAAGGPALLSSPRSSRARPRPRSAP